MMLITFTDALSLSRWSWDHQVLLMFVVLEGAYQLWTHNIIYVLVSVLSVLIIRWNYIVGVRWTQIDFI